MSRQTPCSDNISFVFRLLWKNVLSIITTDFLGNSGIRIGEARNLRWIDLTPLTLDDGEVRVLLSVDGKTGKRDVVCNPNTETYFKSVLKHIASPPIKFSNKNT